MNRQTMPWLGLASYEEKDADIFFGRSQEIEELYGDITHNTQTVIYGPSGTGKTSIIKAGLFGLTRKKNDFFPVYIRLNHDIEESYPSQIIQKIKESLDAIEGEIENKIEPIHPEKISLWEYLHINLFWSKDNYPIIPLIVIDQFEEIFTISKNKEAVIDFFEQFSDICDNRMPKYIRDYLNEKAERKDYPDKINYRIVISLREDFLARLEEYANNIPSLRRNRYSLQAINEEQAFEIIMKPGEGLVSENVAIEIIKKVTNREDFKIDQIPEIAVEPSLLSLFCNELNRKRISQGLEMITLELVEESGDNIISDFYENTLAKVSLKTGKYLEDVLLTQKGYRDSVALGDALANGVTKEEIDILQSNRLIRVDEWDGTKRIEYTHDVLCRVAKEKRDKRNELQKFDEEQKRSRILTEELSKRKKRSKILVSITIFLLLLITFTGLFILWGFKWEYSEYYTEYVKKHGWPTGIGEKLSKNDRESTNLYFKLSRTGYWGNNKHFDKMEAYNAYGRPTTEHSVGTYLVSRNNDDSDNIAKNISEKLKTVYCWRFIPDAIGNVAQEIAYAQDGSVVFVFTISRGSDIEERKDVKTNGKGEKNTIEIKELNTGKNSQVADINKNFSWGIYTDEKGLPLKLRNNGADRVKITYDFDGFEVQHLYYDSQGHPRTNYDGAYGQRYVYDKRTNNVISYNSIDAFGDDMNDDVGNCGMRHYFDKKNRWIKAESFDKEGNICNVKYGYAIVEQEFENDNSYTRTYYSTDGSKAISSDDNNAHRIDVVLDEKGNTIKILYKGIDGELIKGDTCIAQIISKYDKNGNLTCKEFFTQDDELIVIEKKNHYSKFEYEYDITGNHTTKYKFTKRTTDSVFVSYIKESFYDQNGKDTLNYIYDTDEIENFFYDSKKYDEKGNLIYQAYYDKDLKPIQIGLYHKFLRETINREDTVIIVDKYFNASNLLSYNSFQNFAKDSSIYVAGNLIKYIQYNDENNIKSSYIYEYDDFGKQIAQQVMGIFGTPVRNNNYDDMLYYKVKYFTDFSGNYYLKSVNEFEEVSYMEGNDGMPFTEKWGDNKYILYGGKEYLIEKLSEKDKTFFKSKIPYVAMLQIVSKQSTAYTYGIKDGDILVTFGDWNFSFENPNFSFLNSEIIRLREKEKEIAVVRHFPEAKISKVLHFTLPKGSIGIHINGIYYTEREKERLKSTVMIEDRKKKEQEVETKISNHTKRQQLQNANLEDTYLREFEKCKLLPDDEQYTMWGKIIHLAMLMNQEPTMRKDVKIKNDKEKAEVKAQGIDVSDWYEVQHTVTTRDMLQEIDQRLDAYLSYFPDTKSYVPTVKQFYAEVESGKRILGGMVVVATKDNLPHPILKLGDIVLTRKGLNVNNTTEYKAAKETPGDDVLTFFRLEGNGQLIHHKETMPQTEVLVGYLELKE